MKRLIGKRIIVFWTTKAYNAGSDWPSFRVIDATDLDLWCQGVDSPDGTPHDGSKCSIAVCDFLDVIEWKEGA
jgi:hypothetical protein